MKDSSLLLGGLVLLLLLSNKKKPAGTTTTVQPPVRPRSLPPVATPVKASPAGVEPAVSGTHFPYHIVI
jgi:hypothetical protein